LQIFANIFFRQKKQSLTFADWRQTHSLASKFHRLSASFTFFRRTKQKKKPIDWKKKLNRNTFFNWTTTVSVETIILLCVFFALSTVRLGWVINSP
jgi:hypothetical protein